MISWGGVVIECVYSSYYVRARHCSKCQHIYLILTSMPRGSHLYSHSLLTGEGPRHGELGDFEPEQPGSSIGPRFAVSSQKRAKQK